MTINERTTATPTFYDVAEVATMFKMSRMTVYRAINSGELRAIRIRGRLLVPAAVIEGLVAEATAEPVGAAPDAFGRIGGESS
ncbi:helix-turn-helix domain-containing protein [Actinomycetospora endophytica]|uniref:Helix-turn-helix domain-containing protein n=1 Tax=Actinomycetospora endophytica TaxID=2291215 RepID=A0ABS8P853_9PSEU|nr:helix-turn-helix domain-containing protein [Actinomycetospora endophytica]MCD2193586.1 helix-turn-helix domain-containing protein [Actinomycetospora endophytica]